MIFLLLLQLLWDYISYFHTEFSIFWQLEWLVRFLSRILWFFCDFNRFYRCFFRSSHQSFCLTLSFPIQWFLLAWYFLVIWFPKAIVLSSHRLTRCCWFLKIDNSNFPIVLVDSDIKVQAPHFLQRFLQKFFGMNMIWVQFLFSPKPRKLYDTRCKVKWSHWISARKISCSSLLNL